MTRYTVAESSSNLRAPRLPPSDGELGVIALFTAAIVSIGLVVSRLHMRAS